MKLHEPTLLQLTFLIFYMQDQKLISSKLRDNDAWMERHAVIKDSISQKRCYLCHAIRCSYWRHLVLMT